jgi:dipeptidyl aminopeptidase/acylaminoacyl peptidase
MLRATALLLVLLSSAPVVLAQTDAPTRPAVPMDPARAALLYVSNRHEDHDPWRDHARDIAGRERTEATYRERAAGLFSYRKVSYRSRIGDLDIPAYLFEPLEPGDPGSRPALIWVHGGVHGNWSTTYFPFVREAVDRGYVVIAPEYRGSTGYGAEFHNAIDYGGYEVDDVVTAWDWLAANVPQVDPARVAIMGWSHGGYISLLAIQREGHPFRAGVGIVPVTNLIFRLSYKGPGYQRQFATQARIGGLPFERRELYVERSPVYHVDRIQVPVLVHLATNDEDVNFVEAEMLVHALQVKKPLLAETRIYQDPPGGHSFSRRVNPATLERMDTPEQRDSWNRVWAFLEWHLR